MEVMNKKKNPGLNFHKQQEFQFEEVPGLAQAGWNYQAYQQAK